VVRMLVLLLRHEAGSIVGNERYTVRHARLNTLAVVDGQSDRLGETVFVRERLESTKFRYSCLDIFMWRRLCTLILRTFSTCTQYVQHPSKMPAEGHTCPGEDTTCDRFDAGTIELTSPQWV
jgi:hypothetical protein